MVIQMASENACGWGGWCVCRCIARRQCEGSWSAPPLSLLKFVVPLAARADIVGGKLLALPLHHPLVRPSPDTQTEHLNPRAPQSLLR